MKHALHVDHLAHDLRLVHAARNAVEHQRIELGLETVRAHHVAEPRQPELHRDLVGHQLAAARIFEKGLADRRARVELAKHIAARAMKESRNLAEDFSLRAFAAAGRAEDEVSVVFHTCRGLPLNEATRRRASADAPLDWQTSAAGSEGEEMARSAASKKNAVILSAALLREAKGAESKDLQLFFPPHPQSKQKKLEVLRLRFARVSASAALKMTAFFLCGATRLCALVFPNGSAADCSNDRMHLPEALGSIAAFVQTSALVVFAFVFRAIFILAAAALLGGCGRGLDRADLVFLNGAEPESIDPAVITGQPDGRVYTFHLRRNAKWSNGETVTARDFLLSWKRTLTPETAADYAYQLYYVRNARDFNEGKLKDFSQVGLRVPDDFTLEVTLENPTPFFLDLCAFVTLLPVHIATVEACDRAGVSWTKPEHFVGNGAFTLKEWRLFDRVRMVKSETYWNKANIGMKSIDVLPSARPMTAFNFYSTGVADIMADKGLAPTPLMNELKKRPDFHAAPFLGNYFVRYNCKRKPFSDARVRLAFSLVVDKQLLVDKITRAGEVPAFSL